MTSLKPYAVDFATGAEYVGVSKDTLRAAYRAGKVRAKTTTVAPDGRVTGKVLFLITELEAWFDSLEDA